MSRNDITGDEIKSKPNSKEFEQSFDRIFRKRPEVNDDVLTERKIKRDKGTILFGSVAK